MIKTEKLLSHDDSILVLENWHDVREYLAFREKNDVWAECFLNEIGAVGIPDEPLLFPERCRDIRLKRNGYTVTAGSIDPEDPDNAECIASNGIFLVLPVREKLEIIPAGPTAYQSVCRRAGDSCPVMNRWKPSSTKNVLPVQEKAERLNRDLSLHSGKCRILVREGKIRAVLSPEYCSLPAGGLVEELSGWLDGNFPSNRFDRGSASHEFMILEFYLNDREMEEKVRMALNENGADIVSLRTGIRLVTSDVGLANASVSLFYDADGIRMTMGGRIELEHRGDASLDLFNRRLGLVRTMYGECPERIYSLQASPVADVAGTIKNLREEFGVLPKTISEEVEAEARIRFPSGGYASDVYLAVSDILKRYQERTEITQQKYRQICSFTERLLDIPYGMYDPGSPEG